MSGSGMENQDTPSVHITFETLFEILKRERDLSDLQKLDDEFYSQVQEYLSNKQRVAQKNDAVFGQDEKKKAEKQLENAQRLVKDIYDRREKKIINVAVMKSRTKTSIIDTSGFLESEKKLLNELVSYLSSGRTEVLSKVLSMQSIAAPMMQQQTNESGGLAQVHMSKPESKFIDSADNETTLSKDHDVSLESPSSESDSSANSVKTVRFLHAVPKFVGKELEEYGPFDEEDMASLPSEVANILLSKGRVEEIQEN